jgi:cyclopropane-fatty-acyl-phospholipid synthase
VSSSAAAPLTGQTRPSASHDARLIPLIRALRKTEVGCELILPKAKPIRIGDQPLAFRVTVRKRSVLETRVTELSLGAAYVSGEIDIDVCGAWAEKRAENAIAVFKLRDSLPSGTLVGQALRFGTDLALTRPTRMNARAIKHHYSLPDAFYATFLDPEWRFYSQGMFYNDYTAGELINPRLTLEVAAQRKLDHMATALGLSTGQRILDIGAGWGGLVKYCNQNGVRTTSLTLSETSAKYVRALNTDPDSEVLVEDLLDHRRREFYDGVVIFGVIEHIPNYARFCRRVWDALKPGGRLYLDASATREKYALSAFARRYTWQGAHSCLALPDMIQELIFHGFEICEVWNGTTDYERTMRLWALRLDQNHNYIAERWGESVYRSFRVFLWGGVAGFQTDRLQAYTLVARRPPKRSTSGRDQHQGPRPGRLKRAAHFAASLR